MYVIELGKAVLGEATFRAANPDYIEGKPCVYVGLTGRTPEQRFEQHKEGYKSSRRVHRHGLRLVPELFLRDVSYEEAKDKEPLIAEALRKQKGYGVWQN